MELRKLIETTEVLSVVGSVDITISSLEYDSRNAKSDSLFFALPGVKVDGFDYIQSALKKGATAIICARLPESCPANVCFVQVANVRLAMAQVAAEFYGHPTDGIPVVGVTGTNGKTSITYLLESILATAGFKPTVFGTVEYRLGNQRLSASHTTPESVDLMRMMADFRLSGADALILEVSSHALEQHRVDGIDFDLTIFTNLTQDHLDYHVTLDSYFDSKKRLFTELLGDGSAVINCDDAYGKKLLQEKTDWFSFGLNSEADIHPDQIEVGRDGIYGEFSCDGKTLSIKSGMIGHFNVSNLMAAIAAAHKLGISHNLIEKGIAAAPQVPGRVEKVDNLRGILALVDYAHTGDALEQVLMTLKKLEHRRLLTVVGCGGDRDPGKRPVMACAAARYSDLAIFTSDNPRTEDPLSILEQLRQGALESNYIEMSEVKATNGENGFIVVPERRDAIEFAAKLAQKGDLLLVAGKGHEDYQILGTEKIHFDDREELKRIFADGEGKHV
jgi:UDP-N-acetylmuramoyl-L-alanyl-D-glutamate--2,6-diaminopimelate ligase